MACRARTASAGNTEPRCERTATVDHLDTVSKLPAMIQIKA
jgi:hypothetical protein